MTRRPYIPLAHSPFRLTFTRVGALQWPVSRVSDRSAIDTIAFPPLRRIERAHSHPDWTSRSGASSELMKSLFTCLKQMLNSRRCQPPPPTTYLSLSHGGNGTIKFEPCPSVGLVCSAFRLIFVRVCAITRATCNRSVRNRHHRLSIVPAHRKNIPRSPSDQPFRLYRQKCLNIHTHKHRPAHFFQ